MTTHKKLHWCQTCRPRGGQDTLVEAAAVTQVQLDGRWVMASVRVRQFTTGDWWAVLATLDGALIDHRVADDAEEAMKAAEALQGSYLSTDIPGRSGPVYSRLMGT